MTDIIQKLKSLQTELTLDHKSVCILSNKPSRSTLMITKERGETVFIAVTEKGGARVRKRIGNDIERIYRLANKAYTDELASRLIHNRRCLDKAIKEMLPTDYNSILRCLPKNFELLDPKRVVRPQTYENGFAYPVPSTDVAPVEAILSIGSMDPFEWASMPYCENTKFVENKIHMTTHNVFCRSKSEAILFEIYDSLGIPFHYDEVITIGGQKVSPDIIGPRRDGLLIYHEHIGMHDAEYRNANNWKPGLYAAAGIYPGVNLIYTYDDENGAINVNLAKEIIKDIYKL